MIHELVVLIYIYRSDGFEAPTKPLLDVFNLTTLRQNDLPFMTLNAGCWPQKLDGCLFQQIITGHKDPVVDGRLGED